MNDTREAARRWAETWRRAWEARDAEPIVALYADTAVVSIEPFRPPHRGTGADGIRVYVTRVLAEEEDVRVWMSEPIVDGDRAAISWWSSLREAGRDTTLAGTSVLRFDAEGQVAEQWDAWNALDERRDPPPDRGPFSRS